MWIFNFYRFFIAAGCGIGAYFLVVSRIWFAVGVALGVRIMWFFIELFWRRIKVQQDFIRHSAEFRQLYGPYGIRIANKAESDWRIKQSLVEVFTTNIKQLTKTVETLEMMDTLFNAGMRPEGDDYLLHDLKLKYGKERLKRVHEDTEKTVSDN